MSKQKENIKYDLDESAKAEILRTEPEQVMDWTKTISNPYTVGKMEEILSCLGFKNFSDTESQIYAKIIVQASLLYMKNKELDKHNNENEPIRQKLVELEKTRRQKSAPINRLLNKIEKKASDLQKLVEQFENIPSGYDYLSEQQARAFLLLKSFGTLLQNNPLPKIKDKTGMESYPALNTFVRELKEIYERKTRQKAVAHPETKYKENDKPTYGNHYHIFMCACILPLCATHPTTKEIGDYISNFKQI